MAEAPEDVETHEEGSDHAVRTFLIADVRGYTSFTLAHGDEAAARLASRFAEITQPVVEAHDGRTIELRGDEALSVFASARQAMRAATALQVSYAEQSAGDPSTPLQVGIGLDAGEAISVAGGYRGAALNLAARLCSLAGPGEVLTTEAVIHLARRVDGLAYVDRGSSQLKGFADPVTVFRVEREAAPDTAPSISSALGEESAVPVQSLPIGGFLGSLPSSLLVARDAEMGRGLSAVRDVTAGQGRTVLLTGEPGAGKTRLAQEITLQVRNSGFLVAAGRCYEAEATVPYFPFLDALTAVLDAAPPAIRRDAAKSWPYLGAVVPDVIGVPEGVDSSDAQQRVFRAVTAFLQAVAEEAPVALLLDDLHWADSASLKLLLHLARHTRTARVLILGTYRDVEVGRQHPLEAALRELNREGIAERISVRRLNQEGTSSLMASVMGEEDITEEFASLVYARTEGNPFFVQQVMRDMVERGDVYREDGHWERKAIEAIQVPESVRSVIGQRLSRLDDGAQEILREASVLGQTFPFDDLLAMGDRPERQVEAALDAAVAIGILREADGDRYAFDHALTQGALYGELSGRRRRRLHLAAGEALETLPEAKRRKRVAELAWHFLQADDDRALAYAVLAGDDAEAVFAHAEAEMHYRTALDLLRDTADEATEAAVLEKLGRVLRRIARYDEALEELERAAAYYDRSGDRASEAFVMAEMGAAYVARGSAPEAIAPLLRLGEMLDAQAHPQADAALWNALGTAYFITGEYDNSLDASVRAAESARVAGDDRLFSEAEIRRGTALSKVGRVEEANATLDAIIPLARRAAEPERLHSLLNNVGFAHLLAGDLDRSRQYRREGYEIAQKIGDPDRLVFAAGMMCQELWTSGEWEEALRYGEESVRVAQSVGRIGYGLYGYGWLAWVQMCRGQWEAAHHNVQECLRGAASSGDRQGALMAGFIVSRLALLQGRPRDAIRALEPLDPSAASEEAPWLSSVLGCAYCEVGDLDRAERVVNDCVAITRQQGDKWSLVYALQVLGKVLARRGRLAEAAAAFSESVDSSRRMGYPYGEAEALLEWGIMELARGDRDVGRAHLTSALQIFRRLGSRPLVERTERALADNL